MNVIEVLCNLGKGKGSQEIRYLEAESEVNFLKCFSFQLVHSRSSQRLQFDAVCNMRASAHRGSPAVHVFFFFFGIARQIPSGPIELRVSQLANSFPCYIL
jgi:hypothetical protein